MSVTHEALEKAAREKERHAPPPPPLAPAPVAAPPVRPKRKPTRWIVRGVSVAALIVVGLSRSSISLGSTLEIIGVNS
jgi:hypothetical protein